MSTRVDALLEKSDPTKDRIDALLGVKPPELPKATGQFYSYNEFLKEFSGELDPETKQLFASEAKRINAATYLSEKTGVEVDTILGDYEAFSSAHGYSGNHEADWSVMVAHEEHVRKLQENYMKSVGTRDRFENAARAMAGAFVGGTADLSDWIATTSIELKKKFPNFLPTRSIKDILSGEVGENPTREDLATAKFAKWIRSKIKQNAPTDPRLAEEFWSNKVPEGVGSMLFFMAGGAATKSAFVTPMVLGAMSQGANGFNDAVAHGATEDEALKAFVLNTGLGTSEVIPIGKMLTRLNKATGGGIFKAIKNAGAEGLEEALQEFLQTGISNQIAKELYDENRQFLDGAIESGQVGGVTGVFMSLVVSALPGKQRAKYEKALEKSKKVETDIPNEQEWGLIRETHTDGEILQNWGTVGLEAANGSKEAMQRYEENLIPEESKEGDPLPKVPKEWKDAFTGTLSPPTTISTSKPKAKVEPEYKVSDEDLDAFISSEDTDLTVSFSELMGDIGFTPGPASPTRTVEAEPESFTVEENQELSEAEEQLAQLELIESQGGEIISEDLTTEGSDEALAEMIRGEKITAKSLAKLKNTSFKVTREQIDKKKADLMGQIERLKAKVFAREEEISNLQEAKRQAVEEVKLRMRTRIKALKEEFKDKIKSIKETAAYKRAADKQAYLDEKADTREAVKQLRHTITALPTVIRSRFPASMFDSIVAAKSVDTKLARLDEASAKAEQLLEDFQKSILRKAINKRVGKLIKRLNKAKAGQKAFLQGELIEKFLIGIGAIEGEITIPDITDTTDLTDADKELIAIAGMPSIKDPDLSLEDLVNLFMELKSVMEVGQTLASIKMLKKAKKIGLKAREAAREVEATNHNPKARKRFKKVREFASKVNWSLLRPTTIIAMATGKDSSIFENMVIHPINQAATKEHLGQKKLKETIGSLEELHKVNVGNAQKATLTEVAGRPVTVSEGMAIYAYNQNQRGRAHLKNTKWGAGQLVDAKITQVITALPDNYKKFVDAILDFHDDVMYHRINKLFRERYGVSMSKEKRYFPIRFLDKGNAVQNLFNDYSDFVSFHKGFVKQRQKSKIGFDQEKMDFFTVFMSNALNVEHVLAYEPVVMELNSILNNPELSNAMDRFDKQATKYFRDYLKRIAIGRITLEGGWMTTLSNWFRKRSSIAMIGLNIFSAAKASASFSVGLTRVKKAEALKASLTLFSHPVKTIKFVKSKSGYMAQRADRLIRELNEMRESDRVKEAFGGQNLWNRFQEASFAIVNAVDTSSATTIWMAKYSEMIQRNPENEARAILEADKAVQLTQQTGRLEDLPPLFVSGGLNRLWTQYLVDLNAVYNILVRNKATNVSFTKWVETAGFAILLPSIILAAVDGFREEIFEAFGFRDNDDKKDDEEFAADVAIYALSQPLGTVPFVNAIIESQARRIMGDDIGANFSDLTPPAWSAIDEARRLDLSDLDAKSLVWVGGLGLGVPGTQLWAEMAEEIFDD